MEISFDVYIRILLLSSKDFEIFFNSTKLQVIQIFELSFQWEPIKKTLKRFSDQILLLRLKIYFSKAKFYSKKQFR